VAPNNECLADTPAADALAAILEIIVRSLAVYHKAAAEYTCLAAAQVNKRVSDRFLIGLANTIGAVDCYHHLSLPLL
jgi:hypothetical protein